uniref:Tail protein n=1 Tax=viral metagenome TaxID=1070528 RepID=A0A6M3LBK2_9ZZZZ
MSQASFNQKIQYGPEASAYGTETAAYTELFRVTSINMAANNNFIYDRGLGEGLNIINTYFGPFDASGSVGYDVVDFNFLRHWIGDQSGAGTAGDPYILTEATKISAEAETATVLQPFSIESVNDTQAAKSVDIMTGCVGTTFSLSGSIGSKLTCSANFVGQKMGYRATGTTYTPVFSTALVMINGTWKWGATPTTISGVRSFTLNYANGLVLDTRSIESRFLGKPEMGQRLYNGTVTIIMGTALATTIINNFYGKLDSSLYTPETGSVSITPTADLEFKIEFVSGVTSANIWLDQCSIDNISKSVSLGGGLVLLTFAFTAKYGRSYIPISWWATA